MSLDLNFAPVFASSDALLAGTLVTIEITLCALLLSCLLGLLIGVARINPQGKVLYGLASGYVAIIRGTPLMLQLIAIFYGPGLLFDIHILGRFEAVIVAFVINYACYFSEIYRGGIESVPRGQYEAGQVLGMTKSQIFFKVVLLQVVKRILAPMGNEFITLVKDTALARIIAIYEIVYVGESYIKKGLAWPLFYTAAFYLVFNGVLTVLFAKLEKKLNYFRG